MKTGRIRWDWANFGSRALELYCNNQARDLDDAFDKARKEARSEKQAALPFTVQTPGKA